MKLLDVLLNKQVSIYSIINEQDKRVLFGYSTSMVSSISVLARDIYYNTKIQEDRNKLVFKQIETFDEKNELYLRYKVHSLYDEYIRHLGYTAYTSYKPLGWTMYVRVEHDHAIAHCVYFKAFVKLKTSHNKIYSLYKFDTVEEANNFVSNTSILQALDGTLLLY